LGLARAFLHPFSKEKPTHEHTDGVENERANQGYQAIVTCRKREDLSHNVDYSGKTDQPEKDADNF
jgi:hypothetical protein